MNRAKQTSESIELGVLLALSGGLMDAYSYLARGKVFANAQTGNMLLFGVNLANGNMYQASHYLCPVLAFGLGIFLAELVHYKETKNSLETNHINRRNNHSIYCGFHPFYS